MALDPHPHTLNSFHPYIPPPQPQTHHKDQLRMLTPVDNRSGGVQKQLIFFSTIHGCSDMTGQSWPARARFSQICVENPRKLGLIFDGEHLSEPLGGQMGLKIVTFVPIDDTQGVNLFGFIDC